MEGGGFAGEGGGGGGGHGGIGGAGDVNRSLIKKSKNYGMFFFQSLNFRERICEI